MSIFRPGQPPAPILPPPPPNDIIRFRDGFEGEKWDELFPTTPPYRWNGTQQDPGSQIGLYPLAMEGRKSLRCQAPAGAKCCIQKELLGFKSGMDFWYSSWFQLVGLANAGSVFLLDLESTKENGTGRRFMLKEDPGQPLHVILEGKHAGPIFRQAIPTEFPRERWVELTVHYNLGVKGAAMLWQDGKVVCAGVGNLMPDSNPNATYDRLQVGLTINSSAAEQVLYVDDVRLGTLPSHL